MAGEASGLLDAWASSPSLVYTAWPGADDSQDRERQEHQVAVPEGLRSSSPACRTWRCWHGGMIRAARNVWGVWEQMTPTLTEQPGLPHPGRAESIGIRS